MHECPSHYPLCTPMFLLLILLPGPTQPPPNTYSLPPLVIDSNDGISPESRINVDYEVDPKWEYPRDLLQLSEILYDGFSTVLYKGTANGIKSDKAIDVAVKSCKDHASDDDLRALIGDMELLASVGSHPNIIGLLRVCTVESEQTYPLPHLSPSLPLLSPSALPPFPSPLPPPPPPPPLLLVPSPLPC